MDQYADFTEAYLLEGSDDLPLDLTGWTVRASMRNAPEDDGDSLLDFTVIIYDQTAHKGIVSIGLTAEQINSLPLYSQQDFHWDLYVKRPSDGYRMKIMQGTVTVSLGSTHVL